MLVIKKKLCRLSVINFQTTTGIHSVMNDQVLDYLHWASRESIPFRHFINECVKNRTASQLTAIISPFFFLNKLIKDMIDISRYWRWRYQTDFHCYFFFLRHFSNVNVKSIVKTIKFKFNRWWKPPYFITCGDEQFLLSPSCKVFGAIFFADYFGTDLLVIIFFNSDTNIDYFFILIQTSIFKACVLSKAVREFVSYLPHTAAGHNTPIPCT